MAVGDIVPVPGVPFEDTLASASPDLLREMIKGFAQRMMDAEAGSLCGAAYGEVSPERVNSRNGYRRREWDTRAGTVELAIPKLRSGSYFPDWLLQHRRRAEQARQAALFRYRLIQEVTDPQLSARQRGALVRELAGREHDGKRQKAAQTGQDLASRFHVPAFFILWQEAAGMQVLCWRASLGCRNGRPINLVLPRPDMR